EPLLLGNRQRLRRRHDAELRAGVVNHADFADTNAFVDPRAVVSAGTSVESDKASYAVTGTCPLRATSSRADAMNASTELAPWSPPVRVRTDTVPSVLSRSP